MNGQTFVAELEKSGYFSYTLPEKLEEAKSALTDSFDKDRCLVSRYDDERIFSVGDCEALFEAGGVPDLLDEMQSLFAQMNVSIAYSDDDYTDEGHTITVNGRKYIMAQGSILMWGETFLKYAEMINQELELQAKEERIYLFGYDDCQYMILLNERQLAFVAQNVKPECRPLTTVDWETVATESIMRSFNGE